MRLSQEEVEKIIKEMKEKNEYDKYVQMILEDFEENKIVYKLSEKEIIAIAYKNKTIPYKLREYYNWHEMNLLMEEDEGI